MAYSRWFQELMWNARHIAQNITGLEDLRCNSKCRDNVEDSIVCTSGSLCDYLDILGCGACLANAWRQSRWPTT